LSVCVPVDLDAAAIRGDSAESLTSSVDTELQDTDDVQPPYEHLDDQLSSTRRPHNVEDDHGKLNETQSSSSVIEGSSLSSSERQTDQRQQPRSSTKCRVIPIVVSGQSIARLHQLCYETTHNSDSPP